MRITLAAGHLAVKVSRSQSSAWVALVQEPACGCLAQSSRPALDVQGAGLHPCLWTPEVSVLARVGMVVGWWWGVVVRWQR